MKVLITLALLNGIDEPNSKRFLDATRLPLSTTQNAVKYLLDHDYLYTDDEGLKLTDPLMISNLRSNLLPHIANVVKAGTRVCLYDDRISLENLAKL